MRTPRSRRGRFRRGGTHPEHCRPQPGPKPPPPGRVEGTSEGIGQCEPCYLGELMILRWATLGRPQGGADKGMARFELELT
jgi:hypothetical protein